MVRILGEDPEAAEELAVSPSRRWTVGSGPRSPSSARSRSLKVVSGPDRKIRDAATFLGCAFLAVNAPRCLAHCDVTPSVFCSDMLACADVC